MPRSLVKQEETLCASMPVHVFHPVGAETWKTSVTSTISTDAVLVSSRKFCGRKMIFYDQPSYHMILVLSLDWLLPRPNSPGPLMDDRKITNDSSVNFHDMFFFIFCQIIAKNEEKHVMEIYG